MYYPIRPLVYKLIRLIWENQKLLRNDSWSTYEVCLGESKYIRMEGVRIKKSRMCLISPEIKNANYFNLQFLESVLLYFCIKRIEKRRHLEKVNKTKEQIKKFIGE